MRYRSFPNKTTFHLQIFFQIKIESRNDEILQKACGNLLGKRERDIRELVMATMEGHQRAIVGTMTVEQIFRDRKEFSKRVFEHATTDLYQMGFTVRVPLFCS